MSDTIASRPCGIKLSLWHFFFHYLGALPVQILLFLGGSLAVCHHFGIWMAEIVLAVPFILFSGFVGLSYWSSRRFFQEFDLVPGQIISMDPIIFACCTNMSRSWGRPVWAVKVEKLKVGSIPNAKVGHTFACAASYDLPQGRMDAWSNFYPRPCTQATFDTRILEQKKQEIGSELFGRLAHYVESGQIPRYNLDPPFKYV